MPHCYVSGCGSQKGSSHYAIPREPEDRRQAFIAAISVGRDKDWQPSKYSVICSKHFIGNQKSDDRNAANYIPTLNLNVDSIQHVSIECVSREIYLIDAIHYA